MRSARECYSCGHYHALVIDTRASARELSPTYRRYKCTNCGARWTTLEYKEEDLSFLQKVEEFLKHMENFKNATPNRTDKR